MNFHKIADRVSLLVNQSRSIKLKRSWNTGKKDEIEVQIPQGEESIKGWLAYTAPAGILTDDQGRELEEFTEQQSGSDNRLLVVYPAPDDPSCTDSLDIHW